MTVENPLEKPLAERLGGTVISVTIDELNNIYRAGAARGWGACAKAHDDYFEAMNEPYGKGVAEPKNPWKDYTIGKMPLRLN